MALFIPFSLGIFIYALTFGVIDRSSADRTLIRVMWLLVSLCFILTSTVNPFVYAFFNLDIRKAAKSMLCRGQAGGWVSDT